MGKPLLMDQLSGSMNTKEVPCSASLTFHDSYGHFVTIDSSGDAVLAITDSTSIVGWAFSNDTAKSSTAGASKVPVNYAVDAVYLMPACSAGSAVTEANLIAALGKTCDIYTTSSTHQYADIATGGGDPLLIIDYEYHGSALNQQFVHVKQNPYGISGRTGV